MVVAFIHFHLGSVAGGQGELGIAWTSEVLISGHVFAFSARK
jgi:hypothetical protein